MRRRRWIVTSMVLLAQACSACRQSDAGTPRTREAATSTPAASATAEVAGRLTPANRKLLFDPVPLAKVPDDYRAAAGSVETVDAGPILDRLDRALAAPTIGGQWMVRHPGRPAQLYIQSTAEASDRQTLQAEADRLVPGQIRIVHGRYTRTQLQAFADAVVAAHFGPGSPVTSVGQAVRNHDATPTAQMVILVGIQPDGITDHLLDDLAQMVPRSILQIRPERTPTS